MSTSYIEPGSPSENPFLESFNGRLQDELLNIEEFGSITEAKLVIEDLAPRVHHLQAPLRIRRPLSKRVRRNHNQPQNTHGTRAHHRGPVTEHVPSIAV
jgi:hypothetical protein